MRCRREDIGLKIIVFSIGLTLALLLMSAPVQADYLVASPSGYMDQTGTLTPDDTHSVWVSPGTVLSCAGKTVEQVTVTGNKWNIVYWDSGQWNHYAYVYVSGGNPTNYTLTGDGYTYWAAEGMWGTYTYWIYKVNGSSPPPPLPVVGYSANVTSGYSPLVVSFTDTTVADPAATSWSWNFGDGSEIVTTEDATHTYTDSGDFPVSHSATNTQGTGWDNSTTIHVSVLDPPVASLSVNQTSCTSPCAVSYSDSSTGSGINTWNTRWTSAVGTGMQFHDIGSNTYGTDNHNTYTSSGTMVMTGSGDVTLYHTVSNPAGSNQVIYANAITVSGEAPTPTPTPPVPWPNQTGICYGSVISLGTSETYPFSTQWEIQSPDGSLAMGSIIPGDSMIIQAGFTTQLGAYIFQETNLSGQLLWRQSYVVEMCANQTTTPTYPVTTVPTYGPTNVVTLMPTFSPTGIPTVPSVVPTMPTATPTVNISEIPTIVTIPTIPPHIFGNDTLYNFTVSKSPWSKPLVDFIKWFEDLITLNLFGIAGIILGPLGYSGNAINQSINEVMIGMITFSAFPFLFFYTARVIVLNMPDKVQMLAAIVLWLNVLFFAYDELKGKKR